MSTVLKAPSKTVRADLEDPIFGFWIGKGRVVAESDTMTLIYKDPRYAMEEIAKLGSGKLAQSLFADENMAPAPGSHFNRDFLTFENQGEHIQFHVRVRQDSHPMDIKIYPEHVDVPPEDFLPWLEQATSAARFSGWQNPHMVYVGGRLGRLIVSLDTGSAALYVGILAHPHQPMLVPTANIAMLGTLFRQSLASQWKEAPGSRGMLVQRDDPRLAIECRHYEGEIPTKISDMAHAIIQKNKRTPIGTVDAETLHKVAQMAGIARDQSPAVRLRFSQTCLEVTMEDADQHLVMADQIDMEGVLPTPHVVELPVDLFRKLKGMFNAGEVRLFQLANTSVKTVIFAQSDRAVVMAANKEKAS